MKIRNTFKKLSAIIMTFAMLFSIFAITGNGITAKAAGNPVKLYSSDAFYYTHGYVLYDVYIQIDAGSAANKAVYVHHSNGDDEWTDNAATFVTKLDANTEIWKATVSGFGIDDYAIKYVGDGQTYWDNNNGNDYSCRNHLGVANVKTLRSRSMEASNFNIRAAVKNLAYNKIVKVRYTQDNWATYQEANLSYVSSVYDDPNTEIWSTNLNLDENKMDSFQYCISYQVNGQTYWDNNFGSNYNSSFYSPM